MTPRLAVLLVVSYLVGSIPTGVWLARALGRSDPRSAGSGNIGATNVARVLGSRLGALTLLGDVVKGTLPVLVARGAGLDLGRASWVGFAAVVGHVASVFLGWKGGKGVATALGVAVATAPGAAVVGVVVFAISVGITRLVSLGSLTAAVAVAAASAVIGNARPAFPALAAMAMVILVRHRENLGRLRRGEEPRFGARPPGGPDADRPAGEAA